MRMDWCAKDLSSKISFMDLELKLRQMNMKVKGSLNSVLRMECALSGITRKKKGDIETQRVILD